MNASPSSVPHSSHWGRFQALVDQGTLVGIEPHSPDPDPSPLVHGIPDAFHSRVRVRRPAVRESWLRAQRTGEDPRTELRGHDAFVEVSWDEALDLVSGELERVRRLHGNASIFGGSYGWSSAGRFHHARTQLHRFLNTIGGHTDQIGNYSFGAAAAILPHIVGSAALASGRTTSWDVLERETDLWVLFGGLPLKNTQLESGGITQHTARQWVSRIAENGTRFVSVSPLRDDAPPEARAEWLAPRPGTDTAMMLALTHTLLDEGLHDAAFLDRYCVGWKRFASYLLGEGDGTPKSATWAEEIVGLDADVIRDLARRMVSQRTMISVSWSLQRGDHGEQTYWAAIALAAALGQIGVPGGGFGFAYGSTGTTGQPRYPFPAPVLPAGVNATRTAIPAARMADMLLNPGGSYDFNGQRREYPDIRLVYWAGGNPFHHHQDLNRLISGWRRPETVVVHEPWWTATARHADIVLPATTTLERNDIGAAAQDSAIVAMRRAVEPQHEARNDFEIFAALAERLGVRRAFTEDLDEMGWISRLYETTRGDAAAQGVDLPSFEDFWARGAVEIERNSFVLFQEFREDPEAHPLHTPSGRIELFSDVVSGFGYDDCPGHPTWLEPAEWLGSPATARYPLHLISNQPAHRLHSQLDMAAPAQSAKVAGREPCRLNPQDAAERGITDGDTVLLRNDRGICLAGAVVSDAVRPGVIQLSTGAWYEAAAGGAGALGRGANPLEVHGNPNVLTRDQGTSKLGQGSSAQTALVEVERFTGTAAPVTVTAEVPRGVSGSAPQTPRSS
ncbi:dimethylsulfoxide reductase [Leucobacter sp. Psy1]|uniref:molybdopterin guanine dinucleotide-containing S/N-oxide reductase n=1 Tax=Leucobacter sp. Psy1 TaxID=2875729 RepID=UPI001CD3271E|nr:molybdopterin guanine dinucleotide-containing S/N-oxide reductase [Leucobacter sp. Psy1]UBH06078.1 dimethylsulfoxide reductase [Leucobacter sp. Psy1]